MSHPQPRERNQECSSGRIYIFVMSSSPSPSSPPSRLDDLLPRMGEREQEPQHLQPSLPLGLPSVLQRALGGGPHTAALAVVGCRGTHSQQEAERAMSLRMI